MTQRYTREQLFERNNVLVNKRDEEREKEEIERKIRKLKDNEEDMLIALKKFDDDMAMQINRQKREIERVKERIQDLKQEVRVEKSTIRYLIILPIMIVIYGKIYIKLLSNIEFLTQLNFTRSIDTKVKTHQTERKNFISAKYSPNYYYNDKRSKDTASDDSKDFFEKQRERKIKAVESELKSLEERLTETQRDYDSDRKRKLDELKELQHQTRVQASEIREDYEEKKRARRQAERDEEDKQR
jgi:hypothetical protein